MPESETERSPTVWVTDPVDHTTLAHVEINATDKTYLATLADGNTVEISSPEIASALARCLLMAVADEHVPALALRTNNKERTAHDHH